MRALLAVDLRREPHVVVDAAASWAERLGAVVDLVFVDEFRLAQPPARDPALLPVFEREWERMRLEDEAEMGKLLARLAPARRGSFLLLTGPAAAGVVGAADPYDVVVVATHGRTGLAHFWLGSVAERIVRQCEKPVLVLRLPRD